MNECENKISSPRQNLAAGGFLWALTGLSFFVYPLALFPPALQVGQTVYFNLVHAVSIPGTVLLGLLAIPVLFFLPWRLPRPLLWAVAVFAVMLLVNVPGEVEHLNAFFLLFACIAIPLAAGVLLASGYVDSRRVSTWACLLWGVQILLGCIALGRRMAPVGTAGNINWMAGLLLMLSPWVVYGLFILARRYVPHRKTATVLAAAVCLAPTAVILHHCQSRAAWLALGLLPAALAVVCLRRWLHKIVAVGLLAAVGLGCLVVAYVHFPGRLLEMVEKDVRVPLWTGTGVMIAQHPFGVGPGAYRKTFTPLRRVSSYQNRLYAADMTVHPHNELLNVGAQLGIPAMLAFLAMLATVFRSAARDPLQVCARISAYFAAALAMFDMTLVQPPSSFLGLFFLGLCWPVSIPARRQGANIDNWAVPKMLLCGIAVCCALVIVGMDLFHDVHMRRGVLAENFAYRHMDANRRDTGQSVLEEAIAHYKTAVTPFSRIIPYYKISRLSLILPGTLDQAEKYLRRVAAMDPNFSHVNLLLGQLYLRKGDWAAAGDYFSRECRFYPRSERAWQNMYAFFVASGQYGRLDAVDALLGDIYRERARQNLGAGGLAAGTKAFGKAVPGDNPADVLRTAGEMLDRINHAFTDPLFFSITRGRSWPPAFADKEFTVLDAASWRLRRTLHAAMQQDLGPLPASPRAMVSWFSGHIAIEPQGPPAFPLGVWNRRAANALSVYLLFSMACELNGYPSIICTDGVGQPERAYLFARQPADGSLPSVEQAGALKAPAGIVIFEADLAAAVCRPVAPSDFRNRFQWRSGRTFAYFHTSDYFLRNQILGILAEDHIPWLPSRPPSRRLLDLFALTGSTPPYPSLLSRFCFDGHVLRHLDDIHALGFRPTR